MDKLYTIIKQEKLHERLYSLSKALDISVDLLNTEGILLDHYGPHASYCQYLNKNVFQNNECKQAHSKAGQFSYAIGDSYIFTCPAELNHIAFPLINRKLLLGVVLIGPFLMDTADSTLLLQFSEKRKLSTLISLELYDEIQKIPIIEPLKVKQISHLLNFVLSPLLNDDQLIMKERQNKIYQQSKINETIQMYKGDKIDKDTNFMYQKENKLLQKVKNRDIHSAKALLNELLGHVLFAEGENLSNIIMHSLELTTLLSRVVIEAGAPMERILSLNVVYMTQIQNVKTYEELCFILQEVVEYFMHSITLPDNTRYHALIHKAVEYISLHFDEPLSLQSMADLLNISATYFSSIFTKYMKMGFQAYVTKVRIEEAKILLSATQYPINQIALSVGYADQSSFTKAFKRTTGVTPHHFR